MTASGYVYDATWQQERERLAGIEALWDAGTTALLTSCGIRPGMRALEAGAGGGSMVAWLAEAVGPTGHVLAVDLDTRFVDPLRSGTVQILQADLINDALPEGEFDLVHSRLVLEHLNARDVVLDKLVRALRPGGTIVIEDYDWTGFGFDPSGEAQTRAVEGILSLMAAAGFDREYGRKVVSALAERGMGDVRGEGRSFVLDRTHPGFAFFELSFDQLAPTAVEAGLMTVEDAGTVKDRLAGGGQRIITPALVAGIGRAV